MKSGGGVRLTRLDVGLIVALILTSSVWGLLQLSIRPGIRGKEKISSWQKQQEQVRERLRSTFSQEPEKFRAKIRLQPALLRQIQGVSVGIFLLLIGCLWGQVRLISRMIRGRPIASTLGSPPPVAWTFREILRLIVGVILLGQWALLIQWGLILIFCPEWADRHLLSLGNTLFIDLLVMAGAGFLLLRSPREPSGGEGVWASIRFGIGSYLTMLPFLAVLALLVSIALQFLQKEPAPQPIFTIYLSETRTPVLGWLLLLVAVVGPITEEMFFRGILYGWLRTRIGIGRALLLSAGLFAALHTDWFAFAPIFGLGLLFGWVYERTGSLAAPIAIHVFHNAGMLYLAFLVKQILSLS